MGAQVCLGADVGPSAGPGGMLMLLSQGSGPRESESSPSPSYTPIRLRKITSLLTWTREKKPLQGQPLVLGLWAARSLNFKS